MSTCSICEYPSTEVHYGILCCSACAAFFRRSAANKRSYTCRFESDCDVTHKKRLSCRYCRYQKCLVKGMIREEASCSKTSDSDELPSIDVENFETYQPMLADRIYNPIDIKDILDNMSTPELHSSIHNLLKERLQRIFEHVAPSRSYEAMSPLSTCQQGLLGFREHKQRWPGCTKEQVHTGDKEHPLDMDRYVRDFYAELEYIALFCMHIDVFAALPAEQKWVVYKYFFQRFSDLERPYISARLLDLSPDDDRFLSYSGLIFEASTPFSNLDTLVSEEVTDEEIANFSAVTYSKALKTLCIPIRKLKANEFEIVYMILSALFAYNKTSGPDFAANTLELAEQMRTTLDEELHLHYANQLKITKYADRVHKMSNIIASLDKLDEARKEFRQLSRTFNIYKDDVFLSNLFDK